MYVRILFSTLFRSHTLINNYRFTFLENNISVLIAKARQTVGHFNHWPTACEKLKNIQVTLGSSDLVQKALLLMQNV